MLRHVQSHLLRCHLIRKNYCKLCELACMVPGEAGSLYSVVLGMNHFVVLLELRLKWECSWVAAFVPRTVVRTSRIALKAIQNSQQISTLKKTYLAFDDKEVSILPYKLSNEAGQIFIHIIRYPGCHWMSSGGAWLRGERVSSGEREVRECRTKLSYRAVGRL